MTPTPRTKGRPSTTINKLNEIMNSRSTREVGRTTDKFIIHLVNGNEFNDTKRGIEFLKSNEQLCRNADEYTTNKYDQWVGN